MSKGPVPMESVDEKLAKAIECPICLQVLAEPKTLQCGHTFCASCILKMWPKNQSNPYDSVDKQGTPIICPLCRQPSLLCGNMLPTNTALQSIVCHVIKQQENGVPCTSCGQQVIYSAQALCETCLERSSNITLLCFSCACGIHAKAGHTVVQRARTEGHLQNEVLPKLFELSEKAKWMANDAARSAKSAASFLTDTTFLNEAAQTFGKTALKLESLTYCTESFAAENVHAMEQLFGRFEQAVEDFDNLLASTVARIGRFKELATERFFEPEAVSSSKPEAGSSSEPEAGNWSKTDAGSSSKPGARNGSKAEAGSSSMNSNERAVVIGSETPAATEELPKASCGSATAKFSAKPEAAASESGTCERKRESEERLTGSVAKPVDRLSKDLSCNHILFGEPGSATTARIAKVCFPYEAANEDELSLRKDDTIDVIEDAEAGWMKGKLRGSGRIGLFPTNFVIFSDSQPGSENSAAKIEVKKEIVEPVSEMARVLYLYTPAHDDELALKEVGSLVTVVSKTCSEYGWFLGEVDGKKGLVPDNFVEFIQVPVSGSESKRILPPAVSGMPRFPAKPVKRSGPNTAAVGSGGGRVGISTSLAAIHSTLADAVNKPFKNPPTKVQPLYFAETFSEMNLRRDVLHGLKDEGISKPNSLQKRLLCPCITGRSVIVEAPKGSGKLTAACLAVLHKIDVKLPYVQSLIFVPQRETIDTACALLNKLAKNKKLVCYALSSKGQSYLELFKATSGIHILVGCANQIENLVRSGSFVVAYMKILIYYGAEVILPKFVKKGSGKELRQMIANFQTIMMFTSLSANYLALSKQLIKKPYIVSQGAQETIEDGGKTCSTSK